jgi:ABC-type branched-subunit amino acid transport system substrate-binding protein
MVARRVLALARARSVRVGACVLLAAAAAGCGTTAANSTVTVTGKNLTVYAGAPSGGGGQSAQDVIDAERLALSQAGGKAGNFSVRLVTVDGAKTSDVARRVIEDTSAIAYLGEINPGASADSLGITNSQDLLQVSPTDTAIALTESSSAVANSPTLYYESLKTYGRTFARVVPNGQQEAKALVSEIGARGVKRLYVAVDGSDYGRALAAAVSSAAASASISVQHSASGADGILYAGTSGAAAAQLFNGAGPTVRLFAPDALAFDPSFASALSATAAKQVEVCTPGFLRSGLPAAALQQFTAPFKSTYGHSPSTEAIFGYEAMSAVLATLQKAGAAANNRTTVVRDFFGLKNRSSVVGSYSIDVAGDTSIAPFVFSHIKGGQLAPFKAAQEG